MKEVTNFCHEWELKPLQSKQQLYAMAIDQRAMSFRDARGERTQVMQRGAPKNNCTAQYISVWSIIYNSKMHGRYYIIHVLYTVRTDWYVYILTNMYTIHR